MKRSIIIILILIISGKFKSQVSVERFNHHFTKPNGFVEIKKQSIISDSTMNQIPVFGKLNMEFSAYNLNAGFRIIVTLSNSSKTTIIKESNLIVANIKEGENNLCLIDSSEARIVRRCAILDNHISINEMIEENSISQLELVTLKIMDGEQLLFQQFYTIDN